MSLDLRQLQQEEKRQRAAEAATRRLTEQPDAHERESVAGVLGPAEQSSIGEGESVDLARGHTEQQDTHERESEGVVLGLAEEPSTGEEKSAAEARRLAASQSINEIQLEALVDSQNGADNVIPTDDGIDQSNIPIEDMTDILRAAREEPGDEEYAKDLAARERAAIEAGREHLGQNGETVNGGIENFETQELATAENWGTVETAAMGGAAQGTAAGEESMRERAARAAAERAAQAAIQGATAPPAPTPQTAPQTSAAGEAAVRAATARAAAARVAAAGTVDAQAGTDRFRFKTAVEDEETIRTELNKVLSAAVAEKDKPFSGQP
ncbi:hypothetical protein V9T40_005237 [Parthenolecanium corni]|uniref:Uncharacterized protein n=1 Tax=Parthenolecanium corni TaxID=536013 RepID=A0AAN9TFK0_9HEMI